MKRGTPRHPKVAALADRLVIEMYAAVGLLELLWHFTAEYAPAGDIGRHTDQAIARALHWTRKKAPALIDGLVDSRWLDRSELCRLVVHDWQDHADDATQMKLARGRMRFYDGTAPNCRRLPTAERALAEQFYALPVRTEITQDAVLGCVPAGEGRGGEGLAVVGSETEKPEGYLADVSPRSIAQLLWKIHPTPSKFGHVESAIFNELHKTAMTPQRFAESIVASLEAWAEYWRDSGRMATGLENWVSSGDYAIKPPPLPAGKKKALTAEEIAAL